MIKKTYLHLGDHPLPVKLGSLRVSDDGMLEERLARKPFDFTFKIQGIVFACDYRESKDTTRLKLVSKVCDMRQSPQQYYDMKAIIDQANTFVMPDMWTAQGNVFRISKQRTILCGDRLEVTPPISANDLMEKTITFTAKTLPYIHLLQKIAAQASTH
jgi:hypothetical protein